MNTKTVLLVEDDPDNVELTLHAFEQSHLDSEVVVARDGAEALDYLFGTGPHAGRNLDQMPQVILLDLHLPKINGPGVLKRIRLNDRTRTLPVVMLTSSDAPEDMIDCYALGANSYICKPIDFEEYVATVRQLEQYWLTLNQFPTPKGTLRP